VGQVSLWCKKLQNYNETTKECRHTKETLQIFLAFENLSVAKLSVFWQNYDPSLFLPLMKTMKVFMHK